jgi:hypothetical protein
MMKRERSSVITFERFERVESSADYQTTSAAIALSRLIFRPFQALNATSRFSIFGPLAPQFGHTPESHLFSRLSRIFYPRETAELNGLSHLCYSSMIVKFARSFFVWVQSDLCPTFYEALDKKVLGSKIREAYFGRKLQSQGKVFHLPPGQYIADSVRKPDVMRGRLERAASEALQNSNLGSENPTEPHFSILIMELLQPVGIIKFFAAYIESKLLGPIRKAFTPATHRFRVSVSKLFEKVIPKRKL